jgi:hypothetical protein
MKAMFQEKRLELVERIDLSEEEHFSETLPQAKDSKHGSKSNGKASNFAQDSSPKSLHHGDLRRVDEDGNLILGEERQTADFLAMEL